MKNDIKSILLVSVCFYKLLTICVFSHFYTLYQIKTKKIKTKCHFTESNRILMIIFIFSLLIHHNIFDNNNKNQTFLIYKNLAIFYFYFPFQGTMNFWWDYHILNDLISEKWIINSQIFFMIVWHIKTQTMHILS